MKISAMNTSFGARVEEVDLASLTQRDTDLLRAALLEYGLLTIRSQVLSPVNQVRMSEVFERSRRFPPATVSWRSFLKFSAWLAVPPMATQTLAATGIPTARSAHRQRLFRSGIWLRDRPMVARRYLQICGEAYRTLPDDRKPSIDRLITLHRNGVGTRLVIRHPATRDASLYFNVGLTRGIVGYSNESSWHCDMI